MSAVSVSMDFGGETDIEKPQRFYQITTKVCDCCYTRTDDKEGQEGVLCFCSKSQAWVFTIEALWGEALKGDGVCPRFEQGKRESRGSRQTGDTVPEDVRTSTPDYLSEVPVNKWPWLLTPVYNGQCGQNISKNGI